MGPVGSPRLLLLRTARITLGWPTMRMREIEAVELAATTRVAATASAAGCGTAAWGVGAARANVRSRLRGARGGRRGMARSCASGDANTPAAGFAGEACMARGLAVAF